MATIELIPDSVRMVKMSDKEYFGPEYREYISNSKLGLLNPDEGGSFEKFMTGFKQDYSDSFELGTAIHNMTLQPDVYNISPITKPNGKLGVFVESVLKHRRQGKTIKESLFLASSDADYFAGKLSDTRIKTAIKSGLKFYMQSKNITDDNILFLSDSLYPKYQSCIKSLNNRTIKSVLNPSGLLTPVEIFNEFAIFGELKVTLDSGEVKIIKVKGKLDNFIIDHDSNSLVLNDLKTTSKPVGFFMGNNVKIINDEGKEAVQWYDGSFQKYHYYRQMGEFAPNIRNDIRKLF